MLYCYITGEFYVKVTAKRKKNSNGNYGGGDFGLDDFLVTSGSAVAPSNCPDLGMLC